MDAGPEHNDYGNMICLDSVWQTLLELNPALTYNWNIACHLIEDMGPDYIHYKVYRETDDGGFQLLSVTQEISYQDTSIVLSDIYCYKVTALWTINGDTCESAPTNEACEVVHARIRREPMQENIINIYPNPAHDRLNIESDETIEKVRIYNLLGEMILDKEISLPSCILDVSSMKSGIYYLNIGAGKKDFRSKIVILR